MLIGQGGNALTALKLGEGDREAAERILGTTLVMLMIAGIGLFVILAPLTEQIMLLSGATPEVLPLAHDYFIVLLGGFIFQSIGFGINNFIRTAGAPRRAMVTMIIGAVVNIVLNFLFVLVFGWGVVGSATATVIGEVASAVAVLHFFISEEPPFRLRKSQLKLRLDLVGPILKLGFASFAMQAGTFVVAIFLNRELASTGALEPIGADGALAAWGVVSKVSDLFFVPAFGVTMGAQPLMGYNYGARRYTRVRKTFYETLKVCAIVMTAFWLALEIFPDYAGMVFGLEQELIPFTSYGIRMFMLMCPLVSIQVTAGVYFQATGQPLKTAVIETSRQILLFIPLVILAVAVLPGLTGIRPLYAIFIGVVASDVGAILLGSTLWLMEDRRLKRLIAEQGDSA